MIPTMMLFGLIAGRWWKTALVIGAVGWAAIVLLDGAITPSQIPAAMMFGLANTAIGVGIHQGILRLVRRLRRDRSSTAERVTPPPGSDPRPSRAGGHGVERGSPPPAPVA